MLAIADLTTADQFLFVMSSNITPKNLTRICKKKKKSKERRESKGKTCILFLHVRRANEGTFFWEIVLLYKNFPSLV